MTEWSDAEISRRLALAIGWPATYQLPDQTVYVHANPDDRFSRCGVWVNGRVFDYRDPAVIWPIAERFNLFPGKWGGSWEVCDDAGEETSADTAAKAVALAVINAKEQT